MSQQELLITQTPADLKPVEAPKEHLTEPAEPQAEQPTEQPIDSTHKLATEPHMYVPSPEPAPTDPLGTSLVNKTLGAVMRERKAIENDARLMVNRIALLKQEESRALKKIEETKKRAHDIWLMKQDLEERNRQKEIQRQKWEEGQKSNRADLAAVRTAKKLERQEIRDALLAAKHNEMLEIRKQRELNEAKIKATMEKNRNQNEMKHHQVRENKATGAERAKEYKELKLRNLRDSIEAKKTEEEQVKVEQEQQLADMEKYEIELIQRLQHTQNAQKSAYTELKKAIQLSANEFAQIYDTSSPSPPKKEKMSTSHRLRASDQEFLEKTAKFSNQNRILNIFGSPRGVRLSSIPAKKKG